MRNAFFSDIPGTCSKTFISSLISFMALSPSVLTMFSAVFSPHPFIDLSVSIIP